MFAKSPIRIVAGLLVLTFATGVFFQNCAPARFHEFRPGSTATGINNGGSNTSNGTLNASIKINSGAQFTRLLDVGLEITSRGAAEMYVTQTAGCKADGLWEAFGAQRRWVLKASNSSNVVYVMTRNSAGDLSSCEQASIVHDDIAPVPQFTRIPAPFINVPTAGFEFNVKVPEPGPLSYFCQEEKNGTFKPCNSPFNWANLSEGPHDFSVKVVDPAGNESQPITHRFVTDYTAPVLTWTRVPGVRVGQTQTQIQLQVTDQSPVVVVCSIDGQNVPSCSPFNGNLAPGSHTVIAEAQDAAGNIGRAPSYTWTIDTNAPVITITKSPPAVTNNPSVQVGFTAVDDGKNVPTTCSVDGAAFGACTSQLNLGPLAEGPHTLIVRASDDVGNVGTSQPVQWFVDRTPPTITLTKSPANPTNKTNADFTLDVDDNYKVKLPVVECALNGADYQVCSAANTSFVGLKEGTHRLKYRARDAAGNVSVEHTFTWVVDLTKPVLVISQAPQGDIILGSKKTVVYQVSDALSGLETVKCGLDDQRSNCPASQTLDLANLAEGYHRYSVEAVDKAGNAADGFIDFRVIQNPNPGGNLAPKITSVGSPSCSPLGGDMPTTPTQGLKAVLRYMDPVQVRKTSSAVQEQMRLTDFMAANGKYGPVNIAASEIFFGNVFVPTRNFNDGFIGGDGTQLRSASGNRLVEFFRLDYESQVVLAPDDQPGTYQFAVISDDGAILSLNDSVIIDNDGQTPPRMRVAKVTHAMNGNTRLKFDLKYFQGPAQLISATVIWRRLPSANSSLKDALDNVVEGSFYENGQLSKDLRNRGWKPLKPANFLLRDNQTNACVSNPMKVSSLSVSKVANDLVMKLGLSLSASVKVEISVVGQQQVLHTLNSSASQKDHELKLPALDQSKKYLVKIFAQGSGQSLSTSYQLEFVPQQ